MKYQFCAIVEDACGATSMAGVEACDSLILHSEQIYDEIRQLGLYMAFGLIAFGAASMMRVLVTGIVVDRCSMPDQHSLHSGFYSPLIMTISVTRRTAASAIAITTVTTGLAVGTLSNHIFQGISYHSPVPNLSQ